MTDWDCLVQFALALPGVTLGASYGTPALRVKKTLIARLREDGAMVLKVEDGLRETLLETQPDIFYTSEHYAGYPVLLVRLDTADAPQLLGLVERAWGVNASAKLRRERGAAAQP